MRVHNLLRRWWSRLREGPQEAAARAADREVAVREIFKETLANLTLATTLYETSARGCDAEFHENIRDLRRVQDRACGAYRDIFLTAEWRHDRNAAHEAVGETLRKVGVEPSEGLSAALVEIVMQSMPGGAKWPGYKGGEWGV